MDSFINALARAQETAWPQRQNQISADVPPLKLSKQAFSLSPKVLKANRIASFDGADPVTRSFGVLRNTCLKDLQAKVADRPVFGVTSPTTGCGASTTAVNFAFALARQQNGPVLLVDLEPAAPSWWKSLGLDSAGLSPDTVRDTVIPVEVEDARLNVTNLSNALMGQSADEIKNTVRNWLTAVRRDLGPASVVFDLPPLLSDDRTSAIVGEVDLLLMVLATGKSTMAELETSKSYLHDAASVQLVLNKARQYDL